MSKKSIQQLTYAEIDLKALHYNFRQLTKLAQKNKFTIPTRKKSKNVLKDNELIMAVVKADAYGHGMEKIALELSKAKIGYFGVSDISEGITLRKIGIKKPILLFESTLSSQAQDIARHQLMPTVCTRELAAALNKIAQRRKKTN